MVDKKINSKLENKKPVKKVIKQQVKPVNAEAENYDATDLVMGRLSSFIAQKLLTGQKVNIYNAEKAIITGDPKAIVEDYLKRFQYRAKGNPEKGPKYPKLPHLLLKKTIIKMMPPTARGVNASKKLMIYIGNDEHKKLLSVETAKIKQGLKYIELSDLCKKLGAKW